jgi:O-antigen/teichoic acid export membrane protein
MTQANNKRIAKNATWLTIRTIITILVSLYTSRVVLKALGVSDYGIYGIIGGITAMMSFVNSSMAGATSRFITFEMGRGNQERLQRTFSSAMVAHLIIAAAVILIAETVGIWFLNSKMNIPTDRMTAANWVFQFTILSTAISITQVPYNALIIAHERMKIYAYVELLNAFLKLGIVYLLVLFSYDKLILYAVLTLSVAFCIAMIYRIYCVRNFKESHLHLRWDKDTLLPMVKFSVLDLYGNASVVAIWQGRNLLINLFFGVVCNAAVTIASYVDSAIMLLVSAISQAFRPQIIKQYAIGDLGQMRSVMNNSITFSMLALSMIVIPMMLRTEYIINLWLGQTPPYVVQFLHCLLISIQVRALMVVPLIAIHATGNIKRRSFYSGTAYLINPLFVWLSFRLGAPAWFAYVLIMITDMIVLSIDLYLVKVQIPAFPIASFIAQMFRLIGVFICALALTFLIDKLFLPQSSFLSLIVLVLISVVSISMIAWRFILSVEQKQFILSFVKNQILSRMRSYT